jgi:hypothetical protein
MQQEYEAVVQSVVNGFHGPYAIVSVISGEFEGSVTFGLQPPIWNESRPPSGGEFVVISDLSEKRNGWRANRAWFSRQNSRSLAQTPIRQPKAAAGGASRQRVLGSSTTVVEFQDNTDSRQIKQLNYHLKNSTEDERLSQATDLFRLWVEGKRRYEEARSTFGDLFVRHGTKPLLLSLNVDKSGTETLKVWHDLPYSISAEEVAGPDCLLSVRGNADLEKVQPYLRQFLRLYPIRKNSLKNGARIWMNWD